MAKWEWIFLHPGTAIRRRIIITPSQNWCHMITKQNCHSQRTTLAQKHRCIIREKDQWKKPNLMKHNVWTINTPVIDQFIPYERKHSPEQQRGLGIQIMVMRTSLLLIHHNKLSLTSYDSIINVFTSTQYNESTNSNPQDDLVLLFNESSNNVYVMCLCCWTPHKPSTRKCANITQYNRTHASVVDREWAGHSRKLFPMFADSGSAEKLTQTLLPQLKSH